MAEADTPKKDTRFKPGNPGRPKGVLNRKVRFATEFAQSFLKDEDFQDAVRTILCTPKHEHWRWIVEQLFLYAYGRPIEQHRLSSDGSLPEASTYQLAWIDYREFQQQIEVRADGSSPPPLSVPAEELPGQDHRGVATRD